MLNKTNIEVNIRSVDDETINSVTTMYIDEISTFKNKEIDMPLAFPSLKSVCQNSTIITQVGYLDDNSFVGNGYVFSKDGRKWFYNNAKEIDGSVFANGFNKIKFVNGYYYAFFGGGNIMYRSKDLIYWEVWKNRPDIFYSFRDMIFANNEFLVLATGSDTAYIYSSIDGETWGLKTQFTLQSEGLVSSIIYGNGCYYVYSDSRMEYLYRSSDGINFTAYTSYYGYITLQFGYLNNYGEGFVMYITDNTSSSHNYYIFKDILSGATQISISVQSTVGTEFSITDSGELLIARSGNSYPVLTIYNDLSNMTYSNVSLGSSRTYGFAFVYKIGDNVFIGSKSTSQGKLKVYNYNYSEVKEDYILYDLTSGNYSGYDITKNHYGNYINSKYNGILLTPTSSEIENSNGFYDYYSNIYIKSSTPSQRLIINFGDDNIFPTKIKINGIEYNNNAGIFILDFDYNKQDNMIVEFTEINKANAKLKIGSITSIVNYYVSKANGLKSLSIEGVDTGLPSYGIISYTGSVMVEDANDILLTFSNANLLPNINIDIYINNNQQFRFATKNELSLDENTKEVNIELIDDIETLQSNNTTKDMYFSNMTGFQLFNALANRFGKPIALSEKINQILRNIQIGKIVILKGSWWSIWEEFCVGIKARLMKDSSNNYIIKE